MRLDMLINTYDTLAIESRRGTFQSVKTGTVSKQGSPLLNNAGCNIDSSNHYKFDTYAIGTEDFVCMVKASECIGAGTTSPLTTSGGNLRLTIGGNDYDSTVAYSTDSETFAVVADRSGNATFYEDGLKLGNSIDISADVATDIATAIYSMQDFDGRNISYYMYLFIGVVLTESEVAQLTAELESMSFVKKVVGRKATRVDGYVFNGIDDYGTLPETVNVRYDQDFECSYYWKYTGVGTYRTLFGNTVSGANYVGLVTSVNNNFLIYDGVTSSGVSFATAYINVNLYKMTCSYNSTTGIVTISRENLSGGADSETKTLDMISVYGNFSIDLNLLGKRGNNDRYMTGSIFGLKLTTDGVTHYITRDVVMDTANPTHMYSKDIPFKTDFGVLANERAITSGTIENTPFEVQSGSFKVITDEIDGQMVKAVECVTNGTFEPQGIYGGTVWSIYTDTGSGYVESDGTGIISGSVFTVTTGDKISLGNRVGDYSIIKR